MKEARPKAHVPCDRKHPDEADIVRKSVGDCQGLGVRGNGE